MTSSQGKASRLAERARESGFAALQCSGLAIAASHLGGADYSIASLPEMVPSDC